MRFVTFQDEPRREWKDDVGKIQSELTTFDNVTVPVNTSLGFRPMFAIPVTTYKETLTRMLMSAVNYPRFFCLFDTDDYVRVDKLKQYELVRDGTQSKDYPIPIANDALDERYTEYCLNIESLSPMPMRMGATEAIMSLRHDATGFGRALDALGGSDEQFSREYLEIVASYVNDVPIPDYDSMIAQYRSVGWKPDNFDARYWLESSWIAYRYTVMPMMLWSICDDTRNHDLANNVIQVDPSLLESCMHNLSGLLRESNNEATWSYGDCSKAGFDQIYDRIFNMVCDSRPVLDMWFLGRKIGRNDLCPCGSGRKYKKCHGQFG